MSDPIPRDPTWDFLDDDALRIPVKSTAHPDGFTYVIPSPDAVTGLQLEALNQIAAKVARGVEVRPEDVAKLKLDDGQEREFQQMVLGPIYHQMIEDGVSHVLIQRVTQYAYIHFTQGPQAAEQAAREGLFQGGKVRPLNREARRRPQTPTTPSDRPASTASSRKRRR